MFWSFRLALWRGENNARRKDEITKNAMRKKRKDEITPGEKTK